MDASERALITSQVLAANRRFYEAFSAGDLAAMKRLWALRSPVTCLHPGAELISGRSAVMASWAQVLGRQPAKLRCDAPSTELFGTTALVTCYEASGDAPAQLVATNLFVLEEGEWRMVHHHAGPLRKPVPRRSTSVLN